MHLAGPEGGWELGLPGLGREGGGAQGRTGQCSHTPGTLVSICPFTVPFSSKESVTFPHAILAQSVPATVSHSSLRQEDTSVDSLGETLVCSYLRADSPPPTHGPVWHTAPRPVCRAVGLAEATLTLDSLAFFSAAFGALSSQASGETENDLHLGASKCLDSCILSNLISPSDAFL